MALGEPHGGKLIDRRVNDKRRERLLDEAKEVPRILGNERILCDCWQIAVGGFSPLEGFMVREDYERVVKEARLVNGLVWSFPITLPVPDEVSKSISEGDTVAIYDGDLPIALVDVEEIFKRDKSFEIKYFFGVKSTEHPGVRKLLEEPDNLIGGKIVVLNRPRSKFRKLELEPRQTRAEFKRRGWKVIVAFQTRNVPHMAHEYLQRIGLEIGDGLFIHPIIGERKPGDFPPEAIVEAYQWLFENIYPKNKVFISFLWTWMRFAGPREALHHCLIRKNYGATHHIIGRFHASPAGYYSEYEAHKYLKQFSVEELGIQPLLLKGPFYCKKCGLIATDNTCGHGPNDRFSISMTYIRSMIRRNKMDEIPSTIIRREILKIAAKYIGKNEGRNI